MSDTVKLVIEIDESTYKDIKRGKIYSSVRDVPQESVSAIAHGTPLDDSELAETQAYFDGQAYGWEEGRKALIDDVKAEIAEEICLTDNPYSGETKYTIEYSRLLEILDNIVKAESEEESK